MINNNKEHSKSHTMCILVKVLQVPSVVRHPMHIAVSIYRDFMASSLLHVAAFTSLLMAVASSRQ